MRPYCSTIFHEPGVNSVNDWNAQCSNSLDIGLIVLLLTLCVLACGTAHAQSGSESSGTVNGPEPKSAAPEDQSSPASANPREQNKKRGAIIAVPLPTSSPAIGTGVIPVAGYIFNLRKKDTVSPPSVIGMGGLVTNGGSRGALAGGEFYLKQDTYRATGGFAKGNLDYNFYGTGVVNGDAGRHVAVSQDGKVFFGEFLRRLKWNFFAGPRFWLGDSTIEPKNPPKQDEPVVPDLHIKTVLRAIGFRVRRETYLNRFYPTKGSLIDFTGDFFSKSLGSKYSFQAYRFTFDRYVSFGEKQVLAYNLYLCGTGGGAPFYGKCIYGLENELRGYTAGRYIDTYMIATQLEYRRVLWWRMGAVAFGGIGEVAPSISKFNAENLLPAGGGGLRFLLSRKFHVNLRADLAQGKNGHTFSMGVGEAY